MRCRKASDPTSLVKMGSDTSNVGSGSVDRSETINLTLAALVTQVLPNGNLVIEGHQQVRVNNELRDLQVAGIVRPEDITSANTVDLSPDRGGAHLLWRPRHGQRRAAAALRLAALRHPDAVLIAQRRDRPGRCNQSGIQRISAPKRSGWGRGKRPDPFGSGRFPLSNVAIAR